MDPIQIQDVKRLVVNPGETLVVRFDEFAVHTEDQLQEIHDQLVQRLPTGVRVFLTTSGIDFEVVSNEAADQDGAHSSADAVERLHDALLQHSDFGTEDGGHEDLRTAMREAGVVLRDSTLHRA